MSAALPGRARAASSARTMSTITRVLSRGLQPCRERGERGAPVLERDGRGQPVSGAPRGYRAAQAPLGERVREALLRARAVRAPVADAGPAARDLGGEPVAQRVRDQLEVDDVP